MCANVPTWWLLGRLEASKQPPLSLSLLANVAPHPAAIAKRLFAPPQNELKGRKSNIKLSFRETIQTH